MTYLKPKSTAEAGGGPAPIRLHASQQPAQAGSQAGFKMRAIRAGLSLFILFHLFSVLLIPNSDNTTGMRFRNVVLPYVSFFEFTNNWNFFAPNPEPPIYVEYELLGENGEPYRGGRWPEVKDPYFFRERQNRRITAADFMVGLDSRAERMMVNHLCRQNPRPHSLRLWRIMELAPTPQDIVSGRRKFGDEVGAEKKFVAHTFCNEVGL